MDDSSAAGRPRLCSLPIATEYIHRVNLISQGTYEYFVRVENTLWCCRRFVGDGPPLPSANNFVTPPAVLVQPYPRSALDV